MAIYIPRAAYRLLSLLLCSAVVVFWSTQARATTLQEACNTQLSKMDVALVFPTLVHKVDTSVPFKQFPDKPATHKHGLESIGLTVINYTAGYTFQAQLMVDPSTNLECMTTRVDVKVDVAPLHVYIGREFPPGTCAYKEILDHEMRHVNTYQQHFVRVESVLRRELNKRFKNKPPRFARIGQSSKELDQEMKQTWMPYIKSLVDYGNRYHNAIDTQDETNRISLACNGEVQRGMRAANGL